MAGYIFYDDRIKEETTTKQQQLTQQRKPQLAMPVNLNQQGSSPMLLLKLSMEPIQDASTDYVFVGPLEALTESSADSAKVLPTGPLLVLAKVLLRKSLLSIEKTFQLCLEHWKCPNSNIYQKRLLDETSYPCPSHPKYPIWINLD
uniref:Uncharacterized protein n=1 Tax=Corethron hystrix TaxID=216773 RepID=A0A6U5G0W3_9STRA